MCLAKSFIYKLVWLTDYLSVSLFCESMVALIPVRFGVNPTNKSLQATKCIQTCNVSNRAPFAMMMTLLSGCCLRWRFCACSTRISNMLNHWTNAATLHEQKKIPTCKLCTFCWLVHTDNCKYFVKQFVCATDYVRLPVCKCKQTFDFCILNTSCTPCFASISFNCWPATYYSALKANQCDFVVTVLLDVVGSIVFLKF